MILPDSSFMNAIYEWIMGQPDFMAEVADCFAWVALTEVAFNRPIGLCVQTEGCKGRGPCSCPFASLEGVWQNGGTDTRFLNLGIWFTTRPLYSSWGRAFGNYSVGGWEVLETVWTFLRREKSLTNARHWTTILRPSKPQPRYYTNICICICLCMCMCIYVFIIKTFIFVELWGRQKKHRYVCVYIHIYTHTHTHTHT
jgi:hypothetical protein